MINFQIGNSPLQARKNFPFITLIIVTIIILVVLGLVWFLSKKLSEYHKSEKYINKIKNRPSKYTDVLKFGKENNLTQNEISLLWEAISITNSTNINYLFKDNDDVINFFKKVIERFTEISISEEDLYLLFQLEYKLEVLITRTKQLLSTQSIPDGTILLFLSDEGEQLPFQVYKNTGDSMLLEIPEYLFKSQRRPKPYVRQRFVYKANQGISYNFVSRIIRYEDDTKNLYLMIVAHTDKIESTAQRHYKREFVDSNCKISPIIVNREAETPDKKYSVTNKNYDCKLTNISAGGCCIQTYLPIKEKQLVGINLVDFNIEEKIVGIIKRTRRLQNNDFALHIQFIKISIKTKNEILKHVYKYEI